MCCKQFAKRWKLTVKLNSDLLQQRMLQNMSSGKKVGGQLTKWK